MLINIHSAKCIGIDAVPVTVEIEVSTGIGIHLVGLADEAVKESLLRTMSALQAVGYRVPGKKIVINLAPADMHKSGSGYDLPIALGIIAASGQCELPGLGKHIVMGELGLDGTVRNVPGAIPIAQMTRDLGYEGCLLPAESALEAVDLREVNVFGIRNIGDAIRILSDKEDCSDLLVWNTELYDKYYKGMSSREISEPDYMDFSEIIGQDGAKRGLEVAAAGNHNVIMIGSPGSGKSSLAKAVAGILPPMSRDKAILTSKIYSVAGKGRQRYGLMRQRPFRAPHYSASLPAMIGGGNGDNIVPGEVSLAQNGVLFLDEFTQLPRSVTEALRGPLEDRKVTISRLKAKVSFPASFMLVAAANPCPCGYYGEGDRCTCTPGQRQSYFSRLSGPIMDRIDVQLWVHAVDPEKLVYRKKGEPTSVVAGRVAAAREIQAERFAGTGIFTNSEMTSRQMEEYCPLSDQCREVMRRTMENTGLSARAYGRIIKLARTIADLEEAAGGERGPIQPRHLIEAVSYRFLDRTEKF